MNPNLARSLKKCFDQRPLIDRFRDVFGKAAAQAAVAFFFHSMGGKRDDRA